LKRTFRPRGDFVELRLQRRRRGHVTQPPRHAHCTYSSFRCAVQSGAGLSSIARMLLILWASLTSFASRLLWVHARPVTACVPLSATICRPSLPILLRHHGNADMALARLMVQAELLTISAGTGTTTQGRARKWAARQKQRGEAPLGSNLTMTMALMLKRKRGTMLRFAHLT
jgi:hypothetical protein